MSKTPSKFPLKTIAIVYGIVITLFMLVAFVPKMIGEFQEKGLVVLRDTLHSLTNWYDDPTGLFWSYIIGYILIWWKPFWGSAVIIAGCVITFAFNPTNIGTLTMFILPIVVVPILYILAYRKQRTDS